MLTQVVIAALLLMSFVRKAYATPRLLAARVALVGLLLAGILFGTLWIGGDRLVSTIEAAGSDSTAITEREGASRNDIWRASAKLFAAHPVLGAGFGAYWARISAHHDASGVLVPQEAHNDYLELLASGGVVGLLLARGSLCACFAQRDNNSGPAADSFDRHVSGRSSDSPALQFIVCLILVFTCSVTQSCS